MESEHFQLYREEIRYRPDNDRFEDRELTYDQSAHVIVYFMELRESLGQEISKAKLPKKGILAHLKEFALLGPSSMTKEELLKKEGWIRKCDESVEALRVGESIVKPTTLLLDYLHQQYDEVNMASDWDDNAVYNTGQLRNVGTALEILSLLYPSRASQIGKMFSRQLPPNLGKYLKQDQGPKPPVI